MQSASSGRRKCARCYHPQVQHLNFNSDLRLMALPLVPDVRHPKLRRLCLSFIIATCRNYLFLYDVYFLLLLLLILLFPAVEPTYLILLSAAHHVEEEVDAALIDDGHSLQKGDLI